MDLRGVVPMRLRDADADLNMITRDVVDSAIEVQRALGNGLLERPYEVALAHELHLRGRAVARQVRCEAEYKGVKLTDAFVLDLLVDDRVVVELKAVEALASEHYAQLATYLRFASKPVGLLINFRASPLKTGIHRIAGPELLRSSVASV